MEFINIPYNSKTKVYPDGTMVAVYADRPIFKMIPDEAKKMPKINKRILKPIKSEPLSLNICLDNPYCTVDPETGEVILGHYSAEDVEKLRNEGKPQGRRSDNIKRTQDRIYDLVACNEWDYFFTGTLGNTSFDPTNAKEALQPLQSWLKNAVNRHGLKYVLVPEYQPKSGKIHFHGFINSALDVTDSGRRLYKAPTDRRNKAYDLEYFKRKGLNADDYQTIYNIPQWKFGYTTAIKTYNGSSSCARYIMKYITKDSKSIFGRYYWSSRNVKREPDLQYFDDVDFDSIISRSYNIPRTTIQLKYYTYFPENKYCDLFDSWKEAENNSQSILDILNDFEEV